MPGALLPLTRGPLKVAVVGSGASGFYLASRLFRILDGQEKKREGVVGGLEGEGIGQGVRLDVYEKLWAPYGLVRYGVAPDHPEVKVRLVISAMLTITLKMAFW